MAATMMARTSGDVTVRISTLSSSDRATVTTRSGCLRVDPEQFLRMGLGDVRRAGFTACRWLAFSGRFAVAARRCGACALSWVVLAGNPSWTAFGD